MSQTTNVVQGGLDLHALTLDEGSNRGWVQLARTTDGVETNGPKKFEITSEDLAAYAQTIRDNAGRVSIDRDHSFADGKGTAAAGWVDAASVELRNSDTELWAQVDWTPAAAQEIRDGVYRYISPEISFQSLKDGVLRKAKAFLAAALTNRPHFKDMAPVTLTDDDDLEVTVPDYLITLKKSLGLPDEADEATVTAAIAAKDEQIAALERDKSELGKRPAVDEDQMKSLIASAAKGEQASKDLHDIKREQVLKAAIESGKILPVQKDGYATMYDLDAENVVKLLDATPEKSFKAKGHGGTDSAETVDLKAGIPRGTPREERGVVVGAGLSAKVDAHLAKQGIAAPTAEQYQTAVTLVMAESGEDAPRPDRQVHWNDEDDTPQS